MFLGVRHSDLFTLAKQYITLSLKEIEILLESPYYEVRLGAVSSMDFQAKSKKTNPQKRESLYNLYLRRHDRIDNWDFVDRAAPSVIGGYLFDKNREVLSRLAISKNVWERRTAIVSTAWFIRHDEVQDTFKIAEILVNDSHDLIQKAVGGWIREAGKRSPRELLDFLDKYAVSMPRIMLRNAIEKLNPDQRQHYLNAASGG